MDNTAFKAGVDTDITNKTDPRSIPATTVGNTIKNLADLTAQSFDIEQPKGVLKSAFALVQDPSNGGAFVTLKITREGNSLRIKNDDVLLMLGQAKVVGGINENHYVKVPPFNIVLNDGEYLFLNRTNDNAFNPVGISEGEDLEVYAKKRNWFTPDPGGNNAVPVILCYWYKNRFQSFNNFFEEAYKWNLDFAQKATIYANDGGTGVLVERQGNGSYNISTAGAMPVIFDSQPGLFGQIVAGTSVNVPIGYYLLLSKSETDYIIPTPGEAAGFNLYLKTAQFQTIDPSLPHIILGFTASATFESRFDVFKKSVAPPPTPFVSQMQGKTLGVEGDSIMQQDNVTASIRAQTGCLTLNNAVSGSGYVQNVGGTIRSRIVALASANPAAILIAGGTNDWGNDIPLGSKAVLNDDTQFYSAVYNTFRVLRETNKTVPVIVATPIIRNYNNTEPRGFLRNGKTLREFCDAIVWCANQFAFTVQDLNYTSQITYENIFDVASDGVHVGAFGGKMMATPIVADLNTACLA